MSWISIKGHLINLDQACSVMGMVKGEKEYIAINMPSRQYVIDAEDIFEVAGILSDILKATKIPALIRTEVVNVGLELK